MVVFVQSLSELSQERGAVTWFEERGRCSPTELLHFSTNPKSTTNKEGGDEAEDDLEEDTLLLNLSIKLSGLTSTNKYPRPWIVCKAVSNCNPKDVNQEVGRDEEGCVYDRKSTSNFSKIRYLTFSLISSP